MVLTHFSVYDWKLNLFYSKYLLKIDLFWKLIYLKMNQKGRAYCRNAVSRQCIRYQINWYWMNGIRKITRYQINWCWMNGIRQCIWYQISWYRIHCLIPFIQNQLIWYRIHSGVDIIFMRRGRKLDLKILIPISLVAVELYQLCMKFHL